MQNTRVAWIAGTVVIVGGAVGAALVPTTIFDFHLPGTQIGDASTDQIMTSTNCMLCHSSDPGQPGAPAPFSAWRGSLMAQAGRDPLFYAQMTTANQDVANVGYFCMRCHMPNSFVTGHAYQADGSTLDDTDRDGVSCHFCHSMVDPIYKPGISPPEDQAVLAALTDVPAYYGNAMFVLDPSGLRRGPRQDSFPPHDLVYSPFHNSSDMCGTCHDVGNVCVDRRPDGTYGYNLLDQPTPDTNLAHQFPLERTYTEWKLSAFADGGVDMGGRFGGVGGPVVSTCQDCHMPKEAGQPCYFGPERADMAVHEFAGAAAQVLDLIGYVYATDPGVDPEALAVGRARAVSMLERAATLESQQQGGSLGVRVINESGHKLPTGHIEGRRVWVNVKFLDAKGAVIAERGGYNAATADLDEASTTIFEMHVGLTPAAAGATGLPAGRTGHMALADTIVKDTRIPPRGWSNAAYEAGGAPAVGAVYPDGQHWADLDYSIAPGTVAVEVNLYYQNTPKFYIEELRHANHTDNWGEVLHDAWTNTGKGAPILMASTTAPIFPQPPACAGDANGDGTVGLADIAAAMQHWNETGGFALVGDVTSDGMVGLADVAEIIFHWGEICR